MIQRKNWESTAGYCHTGIMCTAVELLSGTVCWSIEISERAKTELEVNSIILLRAYYGWDPKCSPKTSCWGLVSTDGIWGTKSTSSCGLIDSRVLKSMGLLEVRPNLVRILIGMPLKSLSCPWPLRFWLFSRSLLVGCHEVSWFLPPLPSALMVLPHHRPKDNGLSWPWTDAFEPVSQNKSFFMLFLLVTTMKSWLMDFSMEERNIRLNGKSKTLDLDKALESKSQRWREAVGYLTFTAVGLQILPAPILASIVKHIMGLRICKSYVFLWKEQ